MLLETGAYLAWHNTFTIIAVPYPLCRMKGNSEGHSPAMG